MSLTRSGALLIFFVLTLYAAMSFFLVGVVYLFNKPGMLGKSSSGTRQTLTWFIFGPYLALCLVMWCLARLMPGAEPSGHTIGNGLWLGRRLSGTEAHRLTRGIKLSCVIDLAAEFVEAPAFQSATCYQSLPVLDGMSATQDQLRVAVGLIDRFKNQGVMVHCALGHGRSAQVVCAYLLYTGTAQSVEHAISLVAKIRPGVGLNNAQISGLEVFHKSLKQ
jgi:hypothetical protein